MFRALCCAFLSAAGLLAQSAATPSQPTVNTSPQRTGIHRVDPGFMYYRLYAVVPFQGRGTKDDPKRPLFAPSPAEIAARAPGDRTGILGIQYQLSDDKKLALVEFVAATPAAFQGMLTSTDPNVRSFERGKHTRAEIETEFKKHKAGFSFDSMPPVRVP